VGRRYSNRGRRIHGVVAIDRWPSQRKQLNAGLGSGLDDHAKAAATRLRYTLAKREIMLPFELARELKSAGFTQSTELDAVYALSEHLRIRRRDALQMWYGSKRKAGLAVELEQEALYTPTLSELVTACGKPLQLACDESGKWQASGLISDRQFVADGETADESLARLWLLMQQSA
jgi:hypothetical protein